MANVKITGLDHVIANLERIPSVMAQGRDSPVRGALFEAASVIKKAAIANAPIGRGTPMPGLLKRSIYLARPRKAGIQKGVERYVIAVRGSRKKGRGRFFGVRTALAYYWHFVEFGTSGPNGGQRPQKYLTNAFNQNAMASLERFKQGLSRRFDAAVGKMR